MKTTITTRQGVGFVAVLVSVSAIGLLGGAINGGGTSATLVSALPLDQNTTGAPPNLVTSYNVITSDPQSRSASSEIIAEVIVEALSQAQFNTQSGTMPPGAHGDPELDEGEWNVHRSAILNVITLYAGPEGTNRIVMPMMGGIVDTGGTNSSQFIHQVNDVDYNTLQTGDTVMIFGHWSMLARPNSPEPWQARVFDVVDTLANAGLSAIVSTPNALYKYDFTANTARSSEVDGITLPISQLRYIAANP